MPPLAKLPRSGSITASFRFSYHDRRLPRLPALIILIIGENPFEAVKIGLCNGSHSGMKRVLGITLYYTTNFIFTGLGCMADRSFMRVCSISVEKARPI